MPFGLQPRHDCPHHLLPHHNHTHCHLLCLKTNLNPGPFLTPILIPIPLTDPLLIFIFTFLVDHLGVGIVSNLSWTSTNSFIYLFSSCKFIYIIYLNRTYRIYKKNSLRSWHSFNSILDIYRTGLLHLNNDMCALVLQVSPSSWEKAQKAKDSPFRSHPTPAKYFGHQRSLWTSTYKQICLIWKM